MILSQPENEGRNYNFSLFFFPLVETVGGVVWAAMFFFSKERRRQRRKHFFLIVINRGRRENISGGSGKSYFH